jgi:hypothetical protein
MQSPDKKPVDFPGTEKSNTKYADPKNAEEPKRKNCGQRGPHFVFGF